MRWSSLVVLLAVAGCGPSHATPSGPEPAPPASPRLKAGDLSDLSDRIDSYFASGWGTRRIHVQLDRPLYKPGESVWVKTWSVLARDLAPDATAAITYELVDPQGIVVETKNVQQQEGAATNDFVLGAEVPGGKWTLRARLPTGEVDERPFVVASYTTPRIRKELELVREAYGPGDEVEALVELERPTGEPLADHPVQALLQIAGQTVLEKTLTTDETGAVLVSAVLPADLESSDGLLTVLVEDGGITESISRSVPIVLADVQLAFFPEGGDLVQGLPGRVYFEATNAHGEPADVEGVIEDDRGRRVASFSSVHDGLGRFALTPEEGRTYRARITSPVGLKEPLPLPQAKEAGCTLRAFDDFHSSADAVRVAVRCSAELEVAVTGVLREETLDAAVVAAGPKKDAVVYLAHEGDEQGAVRVTVFDRERTPLAERLVYRNHGDNLRIEVTPDREQYGPRDEVVLDVSTRLPSGEPVAAEVALAVVDDAVIGLADDEEGHMLTRLYLEPELVDSPKDPAFYFDPDEAEAARAMDLVMGTKGHRRFEWKHVWNPPPVPVPVPLLQLGYFGYVDDMAAMVVEEARPRLRLPRIPAMKKAAENAPPPMAAAVAGPPPAPPRDRAHFRQDVARDIPWDGEMPMREPVLRDARNVAGGWAAVRVFPKPDYRAGFTGVRTDFRDTVHWEPVVKTDKKGKAEVRFYLSDAVTSFRVTAEGLGGGFAGHSESTLSSVLPVSIATRLPPAVSAGDRLDIPLTVTSTRKQPLKVAVSGQLGSEILTARTTKGAVSLAAAGSDTFWMPVEVGQGSELVTVRLTAEGGGLSDTVEHELNVVPPGFPRSWSAAGQGRERRFTFQLDETVPHSLHASVTWQPSSMSTLITGMEGMIQTPGGCFEQTSSTNWPNVAILKYLEAHDGDPRLKVKSSQALKVGYDKLTGYQVGAGGFETWGSGPGKEALSAFGLLQFRDMAHVYPVDDSVLVRDVSYLLGQRDGSGGFRNSGESAHGYGSAPPDILNGFITYALVEAGQASEIPDEIAKQAQVARKTEDPYVLALAVRSLQGAGHADAGKAAERLAALQDRDGSFPGAASSITRSYEANLLVESTALAAMALMEAPGHRPAADKAADWLVENRRGVGTWGATQATALALAALSRHAEISRVPRTGGVVSIAVNGEVVERLTYDAEQTEPLVLAGWERWLRPGRDNTLVVRQDEGEPLPFTVDVAWTSITPETSKGAELGLQTRLDRSEARMGDTVRLTARIDNQTGEIVPSPIARIGIPAGLEAQTWQLEQLQERGQIAFFETRPREVTLYWDGIHEDEVHEVNLDLTAVVPGAFTAPASSAYPYYDDDEKAWDAGEKVTIAR